MLIIDSRVIVTSDDLDRRAIEIAADRVQLSDQDVGEAVAAYLNALEQLFEDAERRDRMARDLADHEI